MSFSLRLRNLMGPAIMIVAAVIAAGPLLLKGPSCSGDLVFHYVSWINAEHSMLTGLIYPHWANSANFGAGQPEFVFYPPISWMAGAILGMLLPWSFVPLALCILLLAATGIANRAFAREMMGDQAATLAGCAAIFLGYALFNVYERNDFAELTGGFWFPLLLLFSLRRKNPSGTFWERTFDGSATALSLVIAGTWLSNGPLGIMESYLLAAVALGSALAERSMVPVARATACQLLGMGFASIYLIPAIAERHWANIQNALIPDQYAIGNSWLFGRHADPALASHDSFLHRASIVAVLMLAIAVVGGCVAWLRRVVRGERKWWLAMALIPPAVLFLLLPVSGPVWNLPQLRLLQFPWRWLVALEAPMAVWFASAVWFDRKAIRIPAIIACALAFIGISVFAPKWWFVECGTEAKMIAESGSAEILFPGKPEYAPPGIRFPVLSVLVDENGNPFVDPLGQPLLDAAGHPILASRPHRVLRLPSACLLDGAAKTSGPQAEEIAPEWRGELADCDGTGWQQLLLYASGSPGKSTPVSRPEQKVYFGFAKHAGYLILRLRYYPAWAVKVNGNPVTPVAERERGLMAVPVPQGPVKVSADWTTTNDVVVGRMASAAALLLLICLYLFEKKRARPDAVSGAPVSRSRQSRKKKWSAVAVGGRSR